LDAITYHLAPGCCSQLRQFLQGIVSVRAVAGFEFYTYQENAFGLPVPCVDQCFQWLYVSFLCSNKLAHLLPRKKAFFNLGRGREGWKARAGLGHRPCPSP
jgi:hypothetical protein